MIKMLKIFLGSSNLLILAFTITINCSKGVDEDQLLLLASKIPVNTSFRIYLCNRYYVLKRGNTFVDYIKEKKL